MTRCPVAVLEGVVPSNASFVRHHCSFTGRKPRTQTPEQLVGETFNISTIWAGRSHSSCVDEQLHRQQKRKRKLLLPAIKEWQIEHGDPFSFATRRQLRLGLRRGDDVDDGERPLRQRFLWASKTPDEGSLETAKEAAEHAQLSWRIR